MNNSVYRSLSLFLSISLLLLCSSRLALLIHIILHRFRRLILHHVASLPSVPHRGQVARENGRQFFYIFAAFPWFVLISPLAAAFASVFRAASVELLGSLHDLFTQVEQVFVVRRSLLFGSFVLGGR